MLPTFETPHCHDQFGLNEQDTKNGLYKKIKISNYADGGKNAQFQKRCTKFPSVVIQESIHRGHQLKTWQHGVLILAITHIEPPLPFLQDFCSSALSFA